MADTVTETVAATDALDRSLEMMLKPIRTLPPLLPGGVMSYDDELLVTLALLISKHGKDSAQVTAFAQRNILSLGVTIDEMAVLVAKVNQE